MAVSAFSETNTRAGSGFPALSALSEWTLDPALTHLNHGAFGAVPRALDEVQSSWRKRMNANPGQFIMDELYGLLGETAMPVAKLVGTDADRLAFVENASAGIATILASIDFKPGDRVVTTSHVYGAVRNMLTETKRRYGIEVVEVEVACPLVDEAGLLGSMRDAIAQGARLVVIDHVSSASALLMPVAEIVELCREHGVPVVVDGSHAPGMLELDIDAIGADWYVGNCHKWLCGPRGAAFIVTAPDAAGPRPLVVSHAYGNGFPGEFRKVGTRDNSAILTVPAAVDLHEVMGGAALRERNRALAAEAGQFLAEALGGQLAAPQKTAMATISLEGLPATFEAAAALRRAIREQFQIESLTVVLAGRMWLRISAHAYNCLDDYKLLASATPKAIAQLRA